MLDMDRDFEIKKKFRDTVKILIYRKNPDKISENLKYFFSDYYQVTLASSLENKEEFDMINVLESEKEQIHGIAAKKIWIESSESKKEKGIFYGNMKETYRKIFMDQCSA